MLARVGVTSSSMCLDPGVGLEPRKSVVASYPLILSTLFALSFIIFTFQLAEVIKNAMDWHHLLYEHVY